jgi:hypothetical protein
MSIELGDGDDIGAYTEGIQYFIDGHMEDEPDLVRWDYTDAGIQNDVVAGQMDVETVTPDDVYRFSVVAWLGADVFEDGVATTYGVRDMDNGPLVTWKDGAKTTDDLRFFSAETAEPVTHTMTVDELSAIAHLLRYGTPVWDALEEPEDSIHKEPPDPKRNALVTWLEAFGRMSPYFYAFPPPDDRDPGS